MAIKRAAVMGAGVMGAQIAAHLANAGIPTLLLDVVPNGAVDRNVLAAGAIAKMQKTQPSPFVSKEAHQLLTPGNLEDNLDQLADVDWIIEAVIEDLEIKRTLYRKVDAVRKAGSIISSNTSTIPLTDLADGFPKSFRRDFLVAHFFNPPRYMRLLELVGGADTADSTLDTIETFADHFLGKGIVRCNDTPGFIANRIGIFWLQCGIVSALDNGVSVEEADAVMSWPMGIPKTGVFGLIDLIGVDLHPKVDASMSALLAEDDDYQAHRRDCPLLQKMISDGYTGRKGKGGFYRLNFADGKRVKEAINFETGAYAGAQKPQLESLKAAKQDGLRALVAHDDRGGRYAWTVLSHLLAYSASLVPSAARNIVDIDRAMMMGYNWQEGPFALMDRLGVDYFAGRLGAEGREVPALLQQAVKHGGFYRIDKGTKQYLEENGGYRDIQHAPGVMLLEDIKRNSQPLIQNQSASLWDIGDGITCFEIHTKMNAIDASVLKMLRQAIDFVPKAHKAMVIYNEGAQFSVGANIKEFVTQAKDGNWGEIETFARDGQQTLLALKRCSFPVVAAPAGMALGGGCEIILHADAIQAHVESNIGLVEPNVGLIPGWGGCVAMLTRLATDKTRPRGPMVSVTSAFQTIAMITVSGSAYEAQNIGFLRPEDRVTFNRERLLADAKLKALSMVEAYQPPERVELNLPGESGLMFMEFMVDDFKARGLALAHDEKINKTLARVLSGGSQADITSPLNEEELHALEQEAFMELVKTEGSLARMEHMLKTGKPLRN